MYTLHGIFRDSKEWENVGSSPIIRCFCSASAEHGIRFWHGQEPFMGAPSGQQIQKLLLFHLFWCIISPDFVSPCIWICFLRSIMEALFVWMRACNFPQRSQHRIACGKCYYQDPEGRYICSIFCEEEYEGPWRRGFLEEPEEFCSAKPAFFRISTWHTMSRILESRKSSSYHGAYIFWSTFIN